MKESAQEEAPRAGWQMVELNVPVWHMGEASTRKMGLRRAYLQMRNMIRLCFKLDGFLAGLRIIKTILNRACNPWLKLDFETDYTFWRYRPSTLSVNAFLVLAAIGWNFIRLPQTFYRGCLEKKLIARCRATERT